VLRDSFLHPGHREPLVDYRQVGRPRQLCRDLNERTPLLRQTDDVRERSAFFSVPRPVSRMHFSLKVGLTLLVRLVLIRRRRSHPDGLETSLS
jgi:hypothetical protein